MAKSWVERCIALHGVDLSAAAAVSALNALTPSDIDLRPDEFGFCETWIFYDGTWRALHREDLFRQVRTSREWTVAEAVEAVVYGARVLPDAFVVVDQLTDG